MWHTLRSVRDHANSVLERARGQKFLGAALEAKVLVHCSEGWLQERLQQLNAADNGIDPLRYLFISSQAEVTDQVCLLERW